MSSLKKWLFGTTDNSGKMAAAKRTEEVVCEACFLHSDHMRDPRVLPCMHVYCKPCLSDLLDVRKVIRCLVCQKVFEGTIEDLPKFKPEKAENECQTCLNKGLSVAAAIYCMDCTMKFCETHGDMHNVLHAGHTTITIQKFVQSSERRETRYCLDHKDQICLLGCEVCTRVFCTKCVNSDTTCFNARPHHLLDLKSLVANLTAEIEKLKEAMIRKEEKLEALFKQASKDISEFEFETERMLAKLHQTRDDQIREIQTKYDNLEAILVESRSKTKEAIATYMEKEVGSVWSTLASQRRKIETSIKNIHQVDFVREYSSLKKEIRQLACGDLPCLDIKDACRLNFIGEKREIEAEVIPMSISADSSRKLAPKSFVLTKSMGMRSSCVSVCCYKGTTYVGTLANAIEIFDSDLCQKASVNLKKNGQACSLDIYQEKLYALIKGGREASSVDVYDLDGMLINQFSLNDAADISRLAVVSDKVVLVDSRCTKLRVCSPTGFELQNVPLYVFQVLRGSLSFQSSHICRVNQGSVILTANCWPSVHMINIDSGETVWTNTTAGPAEAAAQYSTNLVCVAGDQRICFLDIATGQIVTELVGEFGTRGGFFQGMALDIGGDFLIVADSAIGMGSTLHYYHLKQWSSTASHQQIHEGLSIIFN